MKLKICGIRSEEDLEIINKVRPNFIGFIFYPKSFRYIDFNSAKKLKSLLDPSIKSVGVFVDEDIEVIKKAYYENVFDIVQLHGNEAPAYIEELKKLNIPVIKAIKIKDNIPELDNYFPDYFLFDIDSKTFVGGTGESFNWELLNTYNKKIPYFLAGGINIKNLDKAKKTNAFSLDVSSGVETNKVKDKEKIKEFTKKFKANV